MFAANTGNESVTQNGVTGTFNNGSFTFADGPGGFNGFQPELVDTVFATERFSQNLQFQAAGLGQGTYVVDLYFAEIFANSEGFRVFDVNVEGQTFLEDFDILAQTGGDFNQTLIESTGPITVSPDGVLDISVIASANAGKLSAIVIRETTPTGTA